MPKSAYMLGFRIVVSKGPVMVPRGGRCWASKEEAISACREAQGYSLPTVLANCVVNTASETVVWVEAGSEEKIKIGDPFEYVGARSDGMARKMERST